MAFKFLSSSKALFPSSDRTMLAVFLGALLIFQGNALSTCPTFYRYYLGSCLRPYASPMTRDDASRTCQNDGGSLAIITDYNNLNFVKSLLSNAQYLWIGMQCVGNSFESCMNDQGMRYASDGSFFLPSVSDKPDPTQPNYLLTTDGRFMENDGSFMAPFVCQLSDTPAFQCSNGFNLLNGWCYKTFTSSVPESTAETNCQSQGGHLASIHSSAESVAVGGLYGTSTGAYIGLVYQSWTDGTPLDYVSSNTSPCTLLSTTGSWQSSSCTNSRPYICKKDVTPLTSTSCPSSQFSGTGRIYSPGYPTNYPRTRCEYSILADSGKNVKLQFNRLYLDDSANIYLYNDPYSSGYFALINKNTQNGTTFFSYSNYLRLVFDSQNSSPSDQYKNVWFADFSSAVGPTNIPSTLIPRTTAAATQEVSTGTTQYYFNYCNSSLISIPTQISSPGYPQDYYNNLNCIYALYSNDIYGTIQLTFTTFATEANYDKVMIYDGPSSSYPLIGTLTGTPSVPITYYSSGNYLTVKFTTDGSIVRSGWSAYATFGPQTTTEAFEGTSYF